MLVVQRRLTHYRVPFFDELRRRMDAAGLELQLACGEPSPAERAKADEGRLDWAQPLPTRYLFGDKLCWQPFAHLARDADAVVLTAENKLVCNLQQQYLGDGGRRVLLWGHGANLQGDPKSWRERVKRVVARKADWWLGYTEASRGLIEVSGFPAERITILNNAVDTRRFAAEVEAVTPQQCEALRSELSIGAGPVGMYVGSLYPDRRFAWPLAAAQALRGRISGFELLVLGDGPQRELVQSAAAAHPWIHALGARQGADKALAMSLAQVCLNPGLVGLGILDSFVARVPLVTTDCGLHSPEIAYLEDGDNGVISVDSIEAFVAAAASVLLDDVLARRLRSGCARSAARYTVQAMADRFVDGVQRCLAAPGRR